MSLCAKIDRIENDKRGARKHIGTTRWIISYCSRLRVFFFFSSSVRVPNHTQNKKSRSLSIDRWLNRHPWYRARFKKRQKARRRFLEKIFFLDLCHSREVLFVLSESGRNVDVYKCRTNWICEYNVINRVSFGYRSIQSRNISTFVYLLH